MLDTRCPVMPVRALQARKKGREEAASMGMHAGVEEQQLFLSVAVTRRPSESCWKGTELNSIVLEGSGGNRQMRGYACRQGTVVNLKRRHHSIHDSY